ncbi:MAG: VpsF family polysaccharide biosynthesis protein [Rubrivivax sp.]
MDGLRAMVPTRVFHPNRAGPRAVGLRHASLDTLAWRLTLLGLALHLMLSAHALIHFGWPYEAPLLGPFPFKIHPGTYVICLALLCVLCSRGNPMGAAWQAAVAHPLPAFHLAVMVSCLAWVIWRHGTSGAAYLVDTHWLPALMALLLMHFDDRRRAFLLKVLAVFISGNALLALTEYAASQRLIPLAMEGQFSGVSTEDLFRSSAFLGHPLVNSKLTGLLLPMALLLPMHAAWRWLHVGVLVLALLAFGGRAGLAFCAVVYGTWFLLHLAHEAVRGRWSYLQLTGGSVLLLLAAASMVGVVVVTGVGERIFTTLYLDNSASVRLRVWEAYHHVSTEDLWLGLSAREIDKVALRLGLDPKYEAIENGWIVLSLQFGLVFFCLWLLGFASLLLWLFRQAPALAAAGVLVYLLNASTTNAFASKTITQGVLVTYVVAAAAQRRQQMRQTAARVRQSSTAQGSAASGRKPAFT